MAVRGGEEPFVGVSRVLVVVAHPDDLEAHCGGTVAHLVARGARVTLVACTSGDRGSHDRSLTPGEVGRIREAEQTAAARLLGIAETHFLRWPDGEVENGRTLRGQVVRLVRATRPDVVITHDPDYPWPPYTAHRDHRAVGRATLDALYPDARDHLFFPEQITEEGLEPHLTPAAWLIMSQVPDWVVDITGVFAVKLAARLAHASQVGDPAALERTYRERAAELGARAGVALAEALKIVRFG